MFVNPIDYTHEKGDWAALRFEMRNEETGQDPWPLVTEEAEEAQRFLLWYALERSDKDIDAAYDMLCKPMMPLLDGLMLGFMLENDMAGMFDDYFYHLADSHNMNYLPYAHKALADHTIYDLHTFTLNMIRHTIEAARRDLVSGILLPPGE